MDKRIVSSITALLLATSLSAPAQNTPTVAATGTIQVPGASLPYLIEGSGAPCIVYGSPVYYPRTFSARFKSALRCVHLAERGFVPGAERRDGVPFGIDEAVRDIETARRHLGMDRFIMVGHSVHGLVALAYAARHPQHVSHVIAINAPASLPLNTDSVRAYRARHFSAGRAAQHERNRQRLDSLNVAHPGRPTIATYVANGALYWADSTYDATSLWADMEINQLFTDLQGAAFDWGADMKSVTVPAFVALGRHDYVLPPNTWSGVRSPFPSLTLHVFERAGHTVQYEDPAEFDERVLTWLGGHP